MKTVVLGYDYSREKCLEASTADLHKLPPEHLYLEGEVILHLLGEKRDIIIPEITITDISFFRGKFGSANFLMTPLGGWYSLELVSEQIQEVRKRLGVVSQLAITEKSFDINLLTLKSFESRETLLINKYVLEHYDIFLTLIKYPLPEEIVPQGKDHFQLDLSINPKWH